MCKWNVLVNIVMNLQEPHSARNFYGLAEGLSASQAGFCSMYVMCKNSFCPQDRSAFVGDSYVMTLQISSAASKLSGHIISYIFCSHISYHIPFAFVMEQPTTLSATTATDQRTPSIQATNTHAATPSHTTFCQ